MTLEAPLHREVVRFWRDAGPKLWFSAQPAFDAEIRTRFEAVHMAAAAGGLRDWEEEAEGALALVLVLDQFPRNLYRDTAHAFATDGLAQGAAGRAVARGLDAQVEPALRPFVYMPFVHAEDPTLQERAVAQFEALVADNPDAEENLRFARLHRDIIAKFGRFPHRNAALGRETTAEERAFLDEGGFAG